MGQAADSKVIEIDEARAQLELDLRELEERQKATYEKALAAAKEIASRAKTEAVQSSNASDQDADAAARKGTAGAVTIYEYDDESVGGERLSPDGFNVLSRGDVKMESLLRIRGHFIHELIVMGTDV